MSITASAPNGTATYLIIDNMDIPTGVPEPATWLLAVTALASLRFLFLKRLPRT